jgi:hypothetical protein
MASGFERRGCWEIDDLGAALVQLGDDRVAVESLVGDQRVKLDALDQSRDADLSKRWPGSSTAELTNWLCIRQSSRWR